MRDTWNMTPDEARKYILQNWFDGDENVNAFVCGDEEYTAMAIAVEALEATRWHYTSKGELPDRDGEYLCRYYKYGIRFSEVARYRVRDNKWYHLRCDEEYRVPKPDAWQFIEPPKEEE